MQQGTEQYFSLIEMPLSLLSLWRPPWNQMFNVCVVHIYECACLCLSVSGHVPVYVQIACVPGFQPNLITSPLWLIVRVSGARRHMRLLFLLCPRCCLASTMHTESLRRNYTSLNPDPLLEITIISYPQYSSFQLYTWVILSQRQSSVFKRHNYLSAEGRMKSSFWRKISVNWENGIPPLQTFAVIKIKAQIIHLSPFM